MSRTLVKVTEETVARRDALIKELSDEIDRLRAELAEAKKMADLHKAFHDLVVKERDLARYQLAKKDARIAELEDEKKTLCLQAARLLENEKRLRAELDAWKNAAHEGHPNPCTLGPLCPYCEIEGQDGLIKDLRAELAEATEWNHAVRVCRDHTADIVNGECVICELAEAKERIKELEKAFDALIENAGDWWPDGYEYYPEMQTPILLVGDWWGDNDRIMRFLLRGER